MSCGPHTTEEKIICRAGAISKGGYMDGTKRGEAPNPVRHILMSWRWMTLVSSGFCPYSAPCDMMDRLAR